MKDVKIITVEEGSPLLDQVERLFVEFYDYMNTAGLHKPLSRNGEKMWRSSVEKTLGRFGMLVGAVYENKLVGFAHAIIRFEPDFLGGAKTGYITHVFVPPEFRNMDLGEKMVAKLEEWLRGKGINEYILQVLCDNTSAVKFWEKMGYVKDFFQMSKKQQLTDK